ncbi:hemin ABC transporter, periplasmic hemin-binding protein [gamma proteobacterium NOR5-3]|nr:hemin ABC transporter, periplasmic hemin-binding protein [gamma proteobacterium NOR5-3]
MLSLLLPVAVYADAAPQRVISTDAAITEIVIALGAADRLVGVDDTSELSADQEGLPRLGYHRALSGEGLLSLRPDQLLVSEHAGPPQALAPLQAAAVPVLRLPGAYDVAQLKSNIRLIAAALALPQAGEQLLEDIDNRVERIHRYAPPVAPRAVLLRESNGQLRVAGRDSAGNALLALLGAENAVDYSGYRSFTAEGLLALNPELLVIADEALPAAEQWLNRFPLLRYSRAAEAQTVISVHSRALVGGLSLTALSEAQRLLALMTQAQQAAAP